MSFTPRRAEALDPRRWDGLQGARGKFHWARQHADALRDEILGTPNTMTLTRENQVHATELPYLFVFHYFIATMPPSPPEWGFRLGDIAHNFRCCLDYAAWQLAILDSGGEPDGRTQFPICDSDDAFEAFKWHLKSLTPEHVAVLKACQPHHALDDDPILIGLALIRDINNGDKHQVPRITLSATSDRSPPRLVNVRGCSRAEIFQLDSTVTLEPGAPLLRVAVWNPDPATLNMDVDYKPSFDVVIQEGEPVPVIVTIMEQAVNYVLERVQPLLLAPPLGLA